MKLLTLIRGLPGSGKSHLAEYLRSGSCASHYEADMFFGPDYNFDVARLKEAHTWCQVQVEKDMLSEGLEPIHIIVSNTFTQSWEARPYVALAKKHGYPVQVIECHGPWKSVHKVPEEVIQRMRDRIQSMSEFCLDLGI